MNRIREFTVNSDSFCRGWSEWDYVWESSPTGFVVVDGASFAESVSKCKHSVYTFTAVLRRQGCNINILLVLL